MRARYYDPSTAQFISKDPANALTQSPYGYVDNNPLNDTDPTGLCPWGMGELCHVVKHDGVGRVANDVYHPLRFAATALPTAAGLGVAAASGGDCNWNGKNWVFVCTNSWAPPGASAFTMGSTINTSLNESDFSAANNCRALAHETKHTDQWGILGPIGFPVAYGLDTLQAEARATVFGGPVGQRKFLEQWAGLNDGGYLPPSVPYP